MQSTMKSSMVMRDNGSNGVMRMGNEGSLGKGKNNFMMNGMDERSHGQYLRENSYAVVDNPFRQLNNTKQCNQQHFTLTKPPILTILTQHIMRPCCNNPIEITTQFKLPLQSTFYTMPCSHTICHRCISMFLVQNNGGNTMNMRHDNFHHSHSDQRMIECWHPQCGQGFSSEQAEDMFVENTLVINWIRKMLRLAQVESENQTDGVFIQKNGNNNLYRQPQQNLMFVDDGRNANNNNNIKSSKSASNLFFPPTQRHLQPQQQHPITIIHYNRQQQQQKQRLNLQNKKQQLQQKAINKSILINKVQQQQQQQKQKSSSKDSQQQTPTYNGCVNIFCKKPTLSFYCSQQCDLLVEKLIVYDNQQHQHQIK